MTRSEKEKVLERIYILRRGRGLQFSERLVRKG